MREIKFNDSNEHIPLSGYVKYKNIMTLYYEPAIENLSGFGIYDADGNLVEDCSEYTYRYDILENEKNEISYSNREDIVQTKKLSEVKLLKQPTRSTARS